MNHFPDLDPSWPLLESDLAIDSDWTVLSVEYDYGESAAIILKQTAKGNFKIKCALFDPSEVNITKALTKLGANSSDQICYQEFDLRTHYQPTAAGKPLDGNVFCSELQKILTSCGKDEASIREMATLVFGLLAGYTSQYIYWQLAEFHEKITDSNFRAPIFIARYTRSAWDVLSEIIENICPTQYCTSQSDRFYTDLPRVIPTPLHAQNLTDKIALSVRYINDTEGTMKTLRSELPGQYSGAVVLIDGNGFLNAQLAEFQKHNIWCTQVFFRLPASKMPVDPLPLDARILTKCSLDWDGTLMQTAIAAFSKIHLYKKKKFREILSSAQEKVKRYSSRHSSDRLIGQKKDKYIQLLLTIECFADFVASLPNSPSRNELAAEWSYLLLPGCCDRPRQTCPLEERTSITQADYPDLWQAGMERLFSPEMLHRYQAVGANEICDDVFPYEPEQAVWGYWRNVKKYGKRAGFRALYIPEQTLYDHFDEIFPILCDCYNLLKYIRKHAPAYLHTAKTANLRVACDHHRQTPCIILRIDDIPFLSQDAKQHIEAVFTYIPGSD